MNIPRIGIGYDSHRLIDNENAGRNPDALNAELGLRLGGITIPHTKSLLGHSDADALLHAITDALLGAAAEGDIGQWFPDTAEENRNRDSAEMLAHVWAYLKKKGLEIGNIDAVILAQRPKILPFIPTIRKRIAEILGISENQIGVKAKTGERIGPVGEEKIVEIHAIALLVQS